MLRCKLRHERFLKRRQNLLYIANCDTQNEKQNNNDINDSDDGQLRNDIAHDEGESMTSDNTEDPMTLATTEDPMTLANTETTDLNNTVNSDKSSQVLLKCIEEQVELIALLKHEVGLKTVMSSPALRMGDDDMQTKFYTGLPSYKIFTLLLDKLKTVIPLYSRLGLEANDQFLMVLMKLRLAVPNQDLAFRFGVHVTRVSKIFHHWIHIMSRELKQLISWPDHIVSMENLPECFKPEYKHTKCIIDYSEIFIQRPTSLSARSETYSSYKGHNTVKFLIAISPTGAIIFTSKCWGGRVSDKHITIHSGFLQHLINGDQVL